MLQLLVLLSDTEVIQPQPWLSWSDGFAFEARMAAASTVVLCTCQKLVALVPLNTLPLLLCLPPIPTPTPSPPKPPFLHGGPQSCCQV